MAKRLRPPTRADRLKGLPNSREAAIKAGITRFVDPKTGEEMVIRNYGSRSKPKGFVQSAAFRKESRGGGTSGTRAANEALATPPGADKKAFAKAVSKANTAGMDADHIQDISRTAEGIRFKEESGRGTRAEYHANMAKAKVPVGNQAANVAPLPPDVNQRVKPGQLRAMDAAIKRAGSQADNVFAAFRNAKFRAMNPIMEYATAVDELAGAPVHKGVQRVVNMFRQAVGQAPNPIRGY